MLVQDDSDKSNINHQTIGQGVALSLNSKQSYIENCQLIGHQDTLFVGPLPRDLNNVMITSYPLKNEVTRSLIIILNHVLFKAMLISSLVVAPHFLTSVILKQLPKVTSQHHQRIKNFHMVLFSINHLLKT
jgi:hypothetical protein